MYSSFADEIVKIAGREETHSYYAHPKTKERLIPQLLNKNVAVRLGISGRKVLKRLGKGGLPIRINQMQGQTPDSYQFWVERRANEILPEYGKKTDHYLIDVDPGPKVPFDKTKAVTQLASEQMAKQKGVKNVSVTFTGGRGFHVRGHLKKPVNIDKARAISTSIASTIKGDGVRTGPRTSSTDTRLDTTPLKERGIVRAPWTLNQDTGLVAVPVDNLKTFELSDANPNKVLPGGLKRIRPERPFGG